MKNLLFLLFTCLTSTLVAQNCIDFQDTTFNELILTTQTTFGQTYYTQNNITFRSQYNDPLQSGFDGSAVIGDHIQAGYTGSNGATNFSGNIFYQGWADTEIDFTGIGSTLLVIDFDVNLDITTANPFLVNGAPANMMAAGVTQAIMPLTNGTHVNLVGAINTLTLSGHEIAIDNLCAQPAGTSIEDELTSVSKFTIFPMPVTHQSEIQFSVTESGHYQVEILNLMGQQVKLLDEGFMPEGLQTLSWNGTNASHSAVANGLYFVRLMDDAGRSITRKIQLAK